MGLVINLKAETGLVDRSENTTRFYEDIKDFPTFSKEDEVEWFTKLKYTSDEEKRNEIIQYIMLCNQRLVIAAAKKWAKTDTLMDYVNEANFGLYEAICKFDVDRDVKFNSYAMWFIKRAINSYNNGSLPIVKRTNTVNLLQENDKSEFSGIFPTPPEYPIVCKPINPFRRTSP